VTANLADMDVEEVAAGRYISNGDNDHRTTVAFIGTDIVKHLFPKEDPINKQIQVDGRWYQVVGVAKPLGTVLGGRATTCSPRTTITSASSLRPRCSTCGTT